MADDFIKKSFAALLPNLKPGNILPGFFMSKYVHLSYVAFYFVHGSLPWQVDLEAKV